jgi:hypothetical protein
MGLEEIEQDFVLKLHRSRNTAISVGEAVILGHRGWKAAPTRK